ncbi:MAG: potassium/proton antiporter [Planctomycetia bacterium]|nr:potassium/proton antiporter [Planctomycetia bacterium]
MEDIYIQYGIIAVFLFLGIFASKISSLIKIPTLLMFLIIGMIAGSEGLGGYAYEDYSSACQIGTLALAFILFSGGYDTSWSSVKKVLVPGTILSTLGVFLTALFIGIFTSWYMGWDIRYGLLLGSVVSSTDAATVFAIFRSKSVALKGNLRPLLEYESGSNDPMATFLTVFMISMILHPGDASYLQIVPAFCQRIGVGVLAGVFVGFCVARLMNDVKLEYDGLYYVIGIGTVFLAFSSSEACGGNGFMAVYVCGLVMGNSRFIYKHGLGRFHDGIAWLMQVTLFLALGLLVTPSHFKEIVVPGLAIAAFIMFVARPLSVYLGLIKSSFNFREQTLVAWGGIRGAAPIVLAIFPCLAFREDPEKLDMAISIFHLVFFIVLSSMLIQGKTLMPLARLMRLDEVARAKPRAPLEFEETGRSKSRMYEFEISEGSPIIGLAIRNLNLPENVLVYLIRRDGLFIVPRGGTEIMQDDELMMMMEPESLAQVENLLTIEPESVC